MPSFAGRIAALEAAGYSNAAAMAKLAHDVVLKAAESCGLRENLAIKGGVVMSSVTGDVRRATMDMDIDFVRYGLSDENIDDLLFNEITKETVVKGHCEPIKKNELSMFSSGAIKIYKILLSTLIS